MVDTREFIVRQMEKLAQKTYDLRDTLDSRDLQGWKELDRCATKLSRLSRRMERAKWGKGE